MAIKTKSEITQATIARGRDLATGEIFYVVKSDSSDTTWYTVRWDNDANRWGCNCKSAYPCKHTRAVNEVLQAKRLELALSQPKPTAIEPTEATEALAVAPVVEQEYYTVQIYKHTGLGNEATKTNVLATSQDDACARVAGSCPWLRTNPMFAVKQEERMHRAAIERREITFNASGVPMR